MHNDRHRKVRLQFYHAVRPVYTRYETGDPVDFAWADSQAHRWAAASPNALQENWPLWVCSEAKWEKGHLRIHQQVRNAPIPVEHWRNKARDRSNKEALAKVGPILEGSCQRNIARHFESFSWYQARRTWVREYGKCRSKQKENGKSHQAWSAKEEFRHHLNRNVNWI